MKLFSITCWLITIWCLSAANSLQDGWIEEAMVFPVPDSNYFLTQFRFSIEANAHFPAASTISPALWYLVRSHKFQTLELTLTRGHWPVSSFSSPPPWAAVPPPGLELKVAFQNQNSTRGSIKSNLNLQALGHSLSSLVAASVPTLVDHGVWASPLVGWWSSWTGKSPTIGTVRGSTDALHSQQLYGALTQEGPCVENVSAWLKLLPCRGGGGGGSCSGRAGKLSSFSGLAGMLNAENFVTAPLHSLQLAIDTTTSASDTPTGKSISVILGFTVLQKKENLDAVLLSRAFEYDNNVSFSCPATAESSILLPRNVSDTGAALPLKNDQCVPVKIKIGEEIKMQLCTLTLPSGAKTTPSKERKVRNLEKIGVAVTSKCGGVSSCSWNIDVSSSMIPISTQINKLVLKALLTRPSSISSVTLNGDESSTKSTKMNNSTFGLVHIMQMVPWEVAVRWHTLKIAYSGIPLLLENRKNAVEVGNPAATAAVVWKNFQPAQSRGNAALIEVLLKLPLNSNTTTSATGQEKSDSYAGQVHLQVEIKKKLLTVFDLPPDASRGIDVPAAVFTFLPSKEDDNTEASSSSSSSGNSSIHLIDAVLGCSSFSENADAQKSLPPSWPISRRSSPHLINLPIPDASMPFNVVCFTSTVMALAFGSALNAILTKKPLKKDGDWEIDEEEERMKRRRAIQLRLLRVVVVLLIVGMTAIYMDKDLQRQGDAWLMKITAFWPSAPGAHQPDEL